MVRQVVVEEIMELKAQPGGDVVIGGADLAASFVRHDLIDEYRLYVHPTFGNGVVLLRYQRPDASPGGPLQ